MILKVMFFYLLGWKSGIFTYSHIIYCIVTLRLVVPAPAECMFFSTFSY
jgi:hypothetical protein